MLRRAGVIASILLVGGAATAAPATNPEISLSMDGGMGDGAAASADPGAPSVGASLDRTEALVGDPLTLTVSAVARDSVAQSIRLPEPLHLGKFEVLDASKSDRDLGDGKFARRFVLHIIAYETGELELPGITVAYDSPAGGQRSVATTPIPVRVKSVVGDNPRAEPQPLRPTRSVYIEDRRVWQALRWGAAGLGGLALGWITFQLLKRRKKRPRAVKPAPVIPPHLVALERLRALRRRGDLHVDGYRPFHFELAEILRAYLGARFAFDALELTTTELLAEMDRRGAPPLDGRVAAFLEACDLVKFARAPSTDDRAQALASEAESIVLMLHQPPAPAAKEDSSPPSSPPEAIGG